MTKKWVVEPQHQGLRLDEFVALIAKLSRAQAMKWIEEGKVLLCDKKGRKGFRVQAGQQVEIRGSLQDARSTPPFPQPELPLEVLYKDENLVIVNKPVGWFGHPLKSDELGSLASALVARYSECAQASEDAREGGLCHRLDQYTSGALVAARNKNTWYAMRQAFADGLIEKEYLALCHGVPQAQAGEITLPLLPVSGQKDKMQVAETPDMQYQKGALSAHTTFVMEQTNGVYSLLRVRAHTGRRHQVRVHLSYIGLPLVGDALYGAEDSYAQNGQFLHAVRLCIPPLPNGRIFDRIDVQAPLPSARKEWLVRLLPQEKRT